MPKCAADFRILGWPASLPAAGSRQAAASSSEMVTNMGNFLTGKYNR
jgi:hypothetical protein